MLDFLFAVGQFLCLVGLLSGLVLALRNNRYVDSTKSRRNTARASAEDSGPLRGIVQLAVLPEKPVALIRVVPIETSPLLNGANPVTPAKSVGEQRRPSRRRSMQETIDRARNDQRAALLMKHTKKRPGGDGPRAV
jgi:hypothetical protein